MGRVASTECNRKGPDYFGLFASEVAELISQDEDFLPISDQIFEKSGKVNGVVEEKNSSMNSYIAKEFRYTGGSASLFSNCFGAHVSNFGKERLKLLLRQSVVALSQEVDEILDPVFSICQLRSCLRYKESLLAVPGPVSDSDQGNRPQKKLKASPLSDSKREDLNLSPSMKCVGDLIHDHFKSNPHQTSTMSPDKVTNFTLHDGQLGKTNSVIGWKLSSNLRATGVMLTQSEFEAVMMRGSVWQRH